MVDVFVRSLLRVFFVCAFVTLLLDAAHTNEDTTQGLLDSMSQWRWEENRRTEAWLEPWICQGTRRRKMFQRLTLTEFALRIVLKERSPWLTPSCESDEKASWLAGPSCRGTRMREPMFGCQNGVTAKAGSHSHTRCKRMQDTRPFVGIVSVRLSDQTRLSIRYWNAGPKRGKVADSIVVALL